MSIGALHSAASGISAGMWMSAAAAGNVANVNSVRSGDEEPFRASRVQLADRPGAAGVAVAGVTRVQGDPAVVHAPDSPLADVRGQVATPQVETAAEMTQMLLAHRFVQANIVSLRTAAEAYEDAARLGR